MSKQWEDGSDSSVEAEKKVLPCPLATVWGRALYRSNLVLVRVSQPTRTPTLTSGKKRKVDLILSLQLEMGQRGDKMVSQVFE